MIVIEILCLAFIGYVLYSFDKKNKANLKYMGELKSRATNIKPLQPKETV